MDYWRHSPISNYSNPARLISRNMRWNEPQPIDRHEFCPQGQVFKFEKPASLSDRCPYRLEGSEATMAATSTGFLCHPSHSTLLPDVENRSQVKLSTRRICRITSRKNVHTAQTRLTRNFLGALTYKRLATKINEKQNNASKLDKVYAHINKGALSQTQRQWPITKFFKTLQG